MYGDQQEFDELDQFDEDSESHEGDDLEFGDEFEIDDSGLESPFSEPEEMELATQLLQVGDDAELDQFLGKLFKKAWRGVKKIGRRVVRPLGRVLKSVARKALPFVGGALGSFIPIPGVGTAVGTALGSALGRAFEMEIQTGDPDVQEFEMARRFVRIAGSAARRAATLPPTLNPWEAANAAVTAAARRHVRGIGRVPMAPLRRISSDRGGRWIRRGRNIMVLGA